MLPPDYSVSKVMTIVSSYSGGAATTWLLSELSVKLHTDNRHLSPGGYHLYFGASPKDTSITEGTLQDHLPPCGMELSLGWSQGPARSDPTSSILQIYRGRTGNEI